MDNKTIENLHILINQFQEDTSQYFHTRPLAHSQSKIVFNNECFSFDVFYGLKDLLLIGAITESPVLLTGGTDLGKTVLANLTMNSLFANQWHRLDFDLDFGKDAYANVSSDFFHEKGKTLNDLYSLYDWMKLPGFIADELNGVHPKVARKALHIIKEKDITLPNGQRVKLGAEIENGKTYQFQIAAINEGAEYSGTFDMDKALRRRTTIEIPMDIFRPTAYDRLQLQKEDSEIQLLNKESRLDIILSLLNKINKIELHPIAELFIAYLESFDFCYHSLTEEKSSIARINGSINHVCTKPVHIEKKKSGEIGCPFLRAFGKEMCPNITGITPGVSKNLITVAKAFAALRATKFVDMMAGFLRNQNFKPLSFSYQSRTVLENSLQTYTEQEVKECDLVKFAIEKYITNLEVEQCDIEAAVGFVGYSKMGITPQWTSKYFQGNKFEAIRTFVNEAALKFREGLGKPELQNLTSILEGKIEQKELEVVEIYCRSSNPWLWKVILPYLHPKVDNIESIELYK